MQGNQHTQRWEADRHDVAAERSVANGPRQVLVVDDDEDIRRALRLLLEDEGYRVDEAPDGKPALDRLRESEQGIVVLLDLLMPGMDGLQVMQAVADQEPLATQHAYVLITALADTLTPLIVTLMQQLGVPVVSKPFDIDELLAAVRRASRVLVLRAAADTTTTTPGQTSPRLTRREPRKRSDQDGHRPADS
jgi:CheY-like chemotaxis protein